LAYCKGKLIIWKIYCIKERNGINSGNNNSKT
jgi:hypothetical protein